MSQEDLRTGATDDNSSTGASRRSHRPRSSIQENTETRFVHITDPSKMTKSKPIDDAVNTAVGDAKVKDVGDISPELIHQITQSVIQQLKTAGIADTAQTPVTAAPPVVEQPPQQSPGSPPLQDSPPRIYTPPSPVKNSDAYDSPTERTRGPPPAGRSRRESNISAASDSIQRPRQPRREPTLEEATTLEKIWGKLFDEEGQPTARLGQFLRGIATHLIEDLEPKQSYVVTPKKMLDFYEATQITYEQCPWHTIFDHETTRISRMYRELHVQHHLVQDEDVFHKRPDIPGLTAKGFEKWQTMMIQAYPEEEFERLQKAVVNMPISNPDDRKERFPKDIPRRLFPKQDRPEIRSQLVDAMEQHAQIDLERQDDNPTPKAEYPPPPPRQLRAHRGSDAASRVSFTEGSVVSEESSTKGNSERERRTQIRVPESAIDDHLTPTISTPIERERKPYVAAPGVGKIYDEPIGSPLTHSATYSAGMPPPPPTSQPSLQRSTSNSSKPINIPPPPASATGFTGNRSSASEYGTPLNSLHQAPHLRDPASSRRRNHSPLGNEMRRSDNDLRSFQSSSYEAPSYMSRDGFPPPPPSGQYAPGYDDDRRYGREGDLRRENYTRGGSPSRRGGVDSGVSSDRRVPLTDEEYYRRPREYQQRN